MKSMNAHKRYLRPLLISGGIVVLALSSFAVLGTARGSSINITVRNNSARSMARLYVAAAGDSSNWGPDQLNGSAISPGGSFVINNVACSGDGVRVIAEDQGGCFVYDNASCDGNRTWEITDSVAPDCGGN